MFNRTNNLMLKVNDMNFNIGDIFITLSNDKIYDLVVCINIIDRKMMRIKLFSNDGLTKGLEDGFIVHKSEYNVFYKSEGTSRLYHMSI